MAGTRIFGCSPILGAAFALAATRTVPGKDLLCALVAGYEAGVRAGYAAPSHQDAGWHLTGTLGSIAAAAAVAKLLRLDAEGTLNAIGIGATQAAGLQQNRGTPCKSFHAGKAAQAGLMAGLLAAEGFTCHPEPLEGRMGFASVYSRETRIDALTSGLGRDWLIATNGHKPYACGIFLHPALDVAVEARRRFGAAVLRTAEIDIAVHPDAIRVTGVEEPASGLMSKFSLRSAIALVVRNGAAGARQLEDAPETGNADDAIGRLAISSDAGLGRMAARGVVRSSDGRSETIDIPHATGTRANPMSDAQLDEKFLANVEGVLSPSAAERIRKQIWRAEASPHVLEFVDIG
jgi:2-methylcitrate dehydratase PrpD